MEDLTKEYIVSLPSFPAYKETKVEDVVLYESTVYVHLENAFKVDVYKVPVLSRYRFSRVTKPFLEDHLKRCLVTSKYMLVTHETVKDYPMVDSLHKFHHDFEFNLYNKYP